MVNLRIKEHLYGFSILSLKLLWSFCQTVFDVLFRCYILIMLIALTLNEEHQRNVRLKHVMQSALSEYNIETDIKYCLTKRL